MSKPTRPRVHASVEWESEELRDGGYNVVRHPPGVSISVDFDLHDHERALRMLDAARGHVAAQIEETR